MDEQSPPWRSLESVGLGTAQVGTTCRVQREKPKAVQPSWGGGRDGLLVGRLGEIK